MPIRDPPFVNIQSKAYSEELDSFEHLVAYLASHSEISVSLKWNGRNSGIHHGYPDISQCDNVLEVFTDSDWAATGSRAEVFLAA